MKERMFVLINKNKKTRILALLVAFVMAFGLLPNTSLFADVYEVEYENNDNDFNVDVDIEIASPPAVEVIVAPLATEYITVYVSIEGFTLGHGFYVEPTQVRVPIGSNAMVPTMQVLAAHGLTHEGGAAGITRIHGLFPDIANPPQVIMDGINANAMASMWNPNPNPNGSIGSNDFGMNFLSGWMFAVNHNIGNVGAGVEVLSDGDVVRWMFSIIGTCLGLSVDPWFGPSIYVHESKDALIRALFLPGVSAPAFQHALDVIINPVATTGEIFAALSALETGVLPEPAEIALSVTDLYVFSSDSPLDVTVSNTSSRATSGLTIALSGTHASAFTINVSTLSAIAAGGNDLFTVTPNSGLPVGIYNATVTVFGNNIAMQRFNVRFISVGVVHSGTFSVAGGAPWRLYNDGRLVIGGGIVAGSTAANASIPWHAHRMNITSVIVEAPLTVGSSNSVQHLFSSLSNVRTIEGLQYLNTSNVTTMANMFATNPNLVSIQGMSHWNTSNVTTLGSMFSGAHSLTSLDIANWDTSSVNTLSLTFSNAQSLTSLNLSGWNVSNVTNLSSTFSNTWALSDLNIAQWDTRNVTTMSMTFGNARSLTSLDLSSWDVSRVTNFASTFANTWALESLNLSGWDVGGNITANLLMNNMFTDARSLQSLDLSGWDIRRATNMNAIFQNANRLERVNLSGWNTSSTVFIANVLQPTMANAFQDTTALREITLGTDFEFKINANLPAIPSHPYYTGYWANVGTGTIGNPQGNRVFTSAGLIAVPNADVAGETWVWQPDLTVVRFSTLQAAITEGRLLSFALYTPASWVVFMTALTSAESVVINASATQIDVDNALAVLLAAKDGLVSILPPFRVALNEAIAEAQQRNRTNYTPTSWAEMQTSLNEALSLPLDATQAVVDPVRIRLTASINGLIPLASAPRWQTMMYDALRWLRLDTPNPGISSEWAVLSLARAGIDDDIWYDMYISNLTSALPLASSTSLTDFARITLALTSLGIDASNFSGHDLTAAFANRPGDNPLNGDIFALLAINAGNYSINTQQYIDAILAEQLPDGSWPSPWSADWGDFDHTSMAIQALAPFRSHSAVNTAVNNAVSWITPGQFLSGPENYAQMIVALTGAGHNPSAYVIGLLGYFDTATGGFRSAEWYWEGMTGGGVVNQMSTEQGAYALVAYYRFINGMDTLYSMNDASMARTLQLLPSVSTPNLSGGGGGGGGGETPPTLGTATISVRDPHGNRTFFHDTLTLNANETAYSFLHRTGLNIGSSGGYVYRIEGLSEFDHGPGSGWMVSINGAFPQAGAISIPVRDGDTVAWLYTRELGDDIGGGDVTGSDATPLVPVPPVVMPVPNVPSVNVEIEADVVDGIAVVEVSPALIDSVIAEALTEAAENIIIHVTHTEEAVSIEINLIMESINALIANEMILTLQSYISVIVLDVDTLAGLAYGLNDDTTVRLIVEMVAYHNLSPVQREIVGDNVIIALSIMIDGEYIRYFEGTITITIPYTLPIGFSNHHLLKVFHLDDDGNISVMEDSLYHRGFMTFSTTHFSLFFVDYIGEDADEIEAVEHPNDVLEETLYAYEIMTRAMIVAILWAFEGSPIVSTPAAFTDVQTSHVHYQAIAWARHHGIVNGFGDGTFGPDLYMTSEHFAILLNNFAQFGGFDFVEIQHVDNGITRAKVEETLESLV